MSEVRLCKNCNSEIKEYYCSHCGQEVKDMNLSILSFIKEFTGNLFSLDSKVLVTFKHLIIKPGFLSNEYISSYTKLGFVFGDHAPTENAWRNSSDYAFSVIKSWLLNQPAKVMSMGWDISRISKNLAGQFVYNENKRSISLADLLVERMFVSSEISDDFKE